MFLGEKRLFILVGVGGLALLAVLVSLAIFLTAPRLAEFHPDLPGIIVVAATLAFVVVAIGLGLIALSVVTGRRAVFGQRVTATVMRIVFPLVRMLAAVVGIDRDAIKRSFIAVNNALVSRREPPDARRHRSPAPSALPPGDLLPEPDHGRAHRELRALREVRHRGPPRAGPPERARARGRDRRHARAEGHRRGPSGRPSSPSRARRTSRAASRTATRFPCTAS